MDYLKGQRSVARLYRRANPGKCTEGDTGLDPGYQGAGKLSQFDGDLPPRRSSVHWKAAGDVSPVALYGSWYRLML